MAKREITSRSSPLEVRNATDQLRQAENEWQTTLRNLKELGQGKYLANPREPNKSLTSIELDLLAKEIAAKYDYVDFGKSIKSYSEEIATLDNQRFFVQGLDTVSSTKIGFPESSLSVNNDDAYIFPETQSAISTPLKFNSNDPNRALINDFTQGASQFGALQGNPYPKEITGFETTGQQDQRQAGAFRNASQIASGTVNTPPGVRYQDLNSQAVTQVAIDSERQFRASSTNSNFQTFFRIGQTDDRGRITPPSEQSQTEQRLGESSSLLGQTNSASSMVTLGQQGQTAVPSAIAGTPNNPGIRSRSNILHNFVNWTYKIGWYMLSFNEYNTFVNNGLPPTLNNPIAKSGGINRNAGGTVLEHDLYIQSLRFTSVIGNRLQGAATNNFNLEMTIREPYGAKMIGEIAFMANSLGIDTKALADIPYILEIDFAGYTDSGEPIPSILGLTSAGKKYIPVKAVSIETKIGTEGATYSITFVPYQFYAFTPKYATINTTETIAGRTVEEMLLGEQGLLSAFKNIEKAKVEKHKSNELPDEYNIIIDSFGMDGTKNQKMISSPIPFPQQGGNATPLPNRLMQNPQPDLQYLSLKGNSLVKDIIKNIVLSSQYYNETVNPSGGLKDQAAELIKIIPYIEIGAYDSKRNEYQKKITYKVFNHMVYGENYPFAGTATVDKRGYVKEYNYIFTGKNEDILSLDLNWNLLYYAQFTPSIPEDGQLKTSSIAARQRLDQITIDSIIPGSPILRPPHNTAPNMSTRYINATLAAEFFDNKMNNSNGDNITLDLEIIGDPDWIPQDLSVRPIGPQTSASESGFDNWDSISVDVFGVYVKINMRTPRDYNEATGLMEISRDQPLIQGVYQVITVESSFEDGRFTQRLNLVKVPNQTENSRQSIINRDNPLAPAGGVIGPGQGAISGDRIAQGGAADTIPGR